MLPAVGLAREPAVPQPKDRPGAVRDQADLDGGRARRSVGCRSQPQVNTKKYAETDKPDPYFP